MMAYWLDIFGFFREDRFWFITEVDIFEWTRRPASSILGGVAAGTNRVTGKVSCGVGFTLIHCQRRRSAVS